MKVGKSHFSEGHPAESNSDTAACEGLLEGLGARGEHPSFPLRLACWGAEAEQPVAVALSQAAGQRCPRLERDLHVHFLRRLTWCRGGVWSRAGLHLRVSMELSTLPVSGGICWAQTRLFTGDP